MPGLNGLVVMTPTSIASTGTGNSSSIGANGKVTFSSCATLSLNGVFTSSYDNYMIALRGVTSNGADLHWRLRAAGSDNSTTNSYVSQFIRAWGTSATALRLTGQVFYSGVFYNTQRSGTTLWMFGPNLAQPTAMRSVTGLDYLSASIEDIASTHNQSTSYDGITLLPNAATITGEVTVYGFNQ